MLVASDAVVVVSGDDPSRVEFTLANATNQPALAWCVEVTATGADGAVRRGGSCRTGYSEFAGFPGTPGEPVLVPARGQIRTSYRILGLTGGEQARVAVPCAAFLDGSGCGDPRYADRIAAVRQKNHDRWAAVVDALEAWQSAGGKQAGLVAALRAADKTASDLVATRPPGAAPAQAQEPVLNELRKQLRRWLDGPIPADADAKLGQELGEARHRLEVIQAHILRRQ
jgi:hypothetical protein